MNLHKKQRKACKYNLKEDQRGITLLELIVTMGITTIVIAMVILFLSSGSKSYSYGKNEIDLQMEAQTVMNQMEDMIIGASWVESRWINTDSGASLKGIVIYHKNEISMVFLDTGTKQLYFRDGMIESDLTTLSTMTYTEAENLMSSYVEDIIVATSPIDMNNNQSIQLQLEFVNDTKKYEAVKQVVFRNQLQEP